MRAIQYPVGAWRSFREPSLMRNAPNVTAFSFRSLKSNQQQQPQQLQQQRRSRALLTRVACAQRNMWRSTRDGKIIDFLRRGESAIFAAPLLTRHNTASRRRMGRSVCGCAE